MDSYAFEEFEKDGFPVISFSGYFAGEAGQVVNKAVQTILRVKKKNRIIFDLSGCTIISSPGIAALSDMVMTVTEDYKGKVYLIGLDKSKKMLFQMTGVLENAEIANSLEEVILKAKSL
ncbi:MAG: STAS domain-containing protein [Candidatus Riflebacteria bacterium]|nr:STAS domain-containing protein [Candidatus Riflebacteria bacterium]